MPFLLWQVFYMILWFVRQFISYNSLFVAIIRYGYIVHPKRSNQWDFEKSGKRFQIASFAIPVVMETIATFTKPHNIHSRFSDRFHDCVASYRGLNSTNNVELPKPLEMELTMQYLPEQMVLTIYYIYLVITFIVMMNISEAFLYFMIFQRIQR